MQIVPRVASRRASLPLSLPLVCPYLHLAMRSLDLFLTYFLIFMGFFCNSCSTSFPTRSVLSSHYKRYHRNPIPDDPQVQERYHTKLNGSFPFLKLPDLT